MKKMFDCADTYIQKCTTKDFALLKICLCAAGVMIGLSIPEKKKKWPFMAAGFVFAFSYFLVMMKFMKICMEKY